MITVDELVSETKWLHRVALALVKDEAAADDLTQDAFVVAATETPSDGRPLRPWLTRVLWNRIKVRTRGNKRRRDREDRFGQLAMAPVQPDEIVGRIELHRMLAGLVLALPIAQRDVLLLHFFEGLSSSQIGNRLGISPGTVRWRLKTAIDGLRDQLEQREPNRAWVVTLTPLARTAAPAATSYGFLIAAALIVLALLGGVFYGVTAYRETRPAIAASAKHGQQTDREQLAAMAAAGHAAPTAEAIRTDGTLGAEHRRVRGTVVDATGAFVEGAEVTLDCGYRGANPILKTLTGRNGEFGFDADRECNFVMSATKGNAHGTANRIMAPVDRPLKIKLLPSAHGFVRVLDDETGAPVANATVSAQEEPFGTASSAVTGSDGIARFDVSAPVFIHVAATDYVQIGRALDPRKGHEMNVTGFEFSVDEVVENRPEVHIDVRLKRGVLVSGSIVAPDGSPVANAEVRVAGPTTEDLPPQSRTTSDAHGRFEVTVARTGRFKLWAETDELAIVNGPLRFDVTSDGQTNVTAQLVARAELHGTVIDSAFKPVEGARVSTHDGQTSPVLTDAKGQFMIRLEDDSAFDVIARRGTESSEFQHLQIEYGKQAEAVLQLGPSGISGTAVERDGTPVPGAIIWLNGCCEGGNPSVVGSGKAVADAAGKFTFDVPRGNFVLSVKRSVDDDYEDEDDVKVAGGARDIKIPVP